MSKKVTKPLYLTKRDRRYKSFGAEVTKECKWLGWVPMPWQQEFWDVALEYRKTPGVGRGWEFKRRQAVSTVCRQNGKTVMALSLASFFCREYEGFKVGWVAQDRKVSVSNVKKLYAQLLDRGVAVKFRESTGFEQITFPNGSEIVVVSATERAGHGEGWDLVVGDETWALQWKTMQAVVPAQNAKPSGLMCLISTQGTEESGVLNDLCDRGRSGDKFLTYQEYAATKEANVFDESQWWQWMPGLTQSKFITVNAIRSGAAMFANEPKEFIRAYGNQVVSSDARTFSNEQVANCLVSSLPASPERVCVGVDVSKGPDAASVAAAWIEDGKVFGHIVQWGPGESHWIPEAVREYLRHKPKARVVIGAGPSILVKDELESFTDLVDLSLTSVAGAAMRFTEYIYDGQASFVDTEGEPLRQALEVATPKVVGDRWRFNRVAFGVDQSPLIALSLAVNQAWVESFEPVPSINGIAIGA